MLYIINSPSLFRFVGRSVGVNVIVDDKVSLQTHLYQFYLTRSRIII